MAFWKEDTENLWVKPSAVHGWDNSHPLEAIPDEPPLPPPSLVQGIVAPPDRPEVDFSSSGFFRGWEQVKNCKGNMGGFNEIEDRTMNLLSYSCICIHYVISAD